MAAIFLGRTRVACLIPGLGRTTTQTLQRCIYGQTTMLSYRPESRTTRIASRLYAQGSFASRKPECCTNAGPGVATRLSSRAFHASRLCFLQDEPQAPKPAPPKITIPKRIIPSHENIYTIPNILTFTRLLAAPAIGYLLLHSHHAAAFSLFLYAGLTDLVDGYIARRYNSGTVVGTIIDPMADKTLMTITTVALAVNGSMPVYLAVLILGRDVLLAISAIYYRYISLPPPKTLARYWDFSLPSAEVKPTGISKVNTALQLGLIGATIGFPLVELGAWAGMVLVGWQWTVALTTVWSGASYVYSKDAVKILSREEIREKQEGKQ